MSKFNDSIQPIVKKYLNECLEHITITDDTYKDAANSLIKLGIIRTFASRYATKQKKLDFNIVLEPTSIKDFIKKSVNKVNTKIKVNTVLKSLYSKLDESQRQAFTDAIKSDESISDIIENAEWLNDGGIEEIDK